MAQLLIRNLDDDVKERLAALAAEHGHSMEEEARAILRVGVFRKEADAEQADLATAFINRFSGLGFDGQLPGFPGTIEPVRFGDDE